MKKLLSIAIVCSTMVMANAYADCLAWSRFYGNGDTGIGAISSGRKTMIYSEHVYSIANMTDRPWNVSVCYTIGVMNYNHSAEYIHPACTNVHLEPHTQVYHQKLPSEVEVLFNGEGYVAGIVKTELRGDCTASAEQKARFWVSEKKR